MQVPYVDIPNQHAPMKDQLLAAVAQVIDSGRFVLGSQVDEFERRFAQLCGVGYAVGVKSGTDALILALRALGVGPGDEVITSPNSFVASASCIALLGAKPVFVDVGEDYNIDPELIEEAVTARTKAIIPVHLTGRPADMDPILEIARTRRLHVVEDSAQAVGAEYKGKSVGSLGTIGCFSLHPLKTLNACGDGGVLTTNDPGLHEELKLLRNHGLINRDEAGTWGYNSRLDTLQAAILLVKLDYLPEWTKQRRITACTYQKHLDCLAQIQCPMDRSYERAVYHTFVIQANRRDALKAHLAENGVGTAIHYPIPIHLQQAASSLGYGPGSFPVAEKQAGRILSLPIHTGLGTDDIQRVVASIRSFYQDLEA